MVRKTRVRRGTRFTYSYRCGNCMGCRILRQREWAGRIILESLCHEPGTSWFVTLTYKPEKYPANGSLDKAVIPRFMRRVRKRLRDTQRRVRFFAVGEYGSKTQRAHYHIILFGVSASVVEDSVRLAWSENGQSLGFVSVSELLPTRARYVAQYTLKKLTRPCLSLDGRAPEFALMSRKPGIGLGQLVSMAHSLKRYGLTFHSGPSRDDPGSRTPTTSTGWYRFEGRLYPLDRYLRTRLATLLGEPVAQSWGAAHIRSEVARRKVMDDNVFIEQDRFVERVKDGQEI